MSQSIKAALLSGLIFPGVGQLSLGYKKRGWLFVGASLVFLYLIISEIIQAAYSVVAEMQKNGVIDVETISNTTSAMVSFSDNSFLNVLLLLLIAGWVVSIIDAYRLGKKQT